MPTVANVEEQKNVAAATSVEQTAKEAAPKKRRGRGISNETRTTSQLKYNEKDANRANMLFTGVVDSVEIKTAAIGEEVTGMPSFAGQTIPVFVVRFHSLHQNPNEWRWVSLRFMPAESNAETIPGAKSAWKVDSVLSYIKHLLDVLYLKGRDLTEKEEDALTLPFEDFVEENGTFVYEPVPTEEVIKGYEYVFNNAAAMLNGTWKLADGAAPKPCYIGTDGKRLWLWLKLLRFTKVKNNWQPVVRGKSTMGDLGFTNFLGEGVIELYQKDKAPILRVDPIKESITPKEIAKAPMQPTMPGIMPGAVIGAPMAAPMIGGNIPSMGDQPAVDYNQFDANPIDDMPF